MATGDVLRGGRFVLLEPLGEGAQGQTFAGVDKLEGRPVAIKRFDVRGARTWKEAELAEREAQVLQSLSHPKLPRYVDHFEHHGALYLVMEKIEGESLANLRRRGVVFGEADVAGLLSDASQVLEYLLSRTPPVIHRDLKPGNILRKPDGSFAFVDFGSVRDKLRPEGGSTVVGTFGYMAPEQFQGRAFAASDAYGIGATALSMLTGFEPETLPHKGLAIDVRAALGSSQRGPLVSVLERLLDPDPDRRASQIAPLLSQLEVPQRRSQPAARPKPSRAEPGFRSRGDVGSIFDRQAQEFERRADEFDRRGALGGPGSRRWRKGAARHRKAAERMREAAQRFELAEGQREARFASRRARSMVRVGPHGRAYGGPPWPVRLVVGILFTIGMFAVLVATQVVVPLVLQILAIVLARRSLLSAALNVRRAGQAAAQHISRSRSWFVDYGYDEESSAPPGRDRPGRARARFRSRRRSASEGLQDPPLEECEEEWPSADGNKRQS